MMIEEKMREVVTLLRAPTPLNKFTEQESFEVAAWAQASLVRDPGDAVAKEAGGLVEWPRLRAKAGPQ